MAELNEAIHEPTLPEKTKDALNVDGELQWMKQN
jgi:hypothetical protein